MDKNKKNFNKIGKQKMKKQKNPNISTSTSLVAAEVPTVPKKEKEPISIAKKEFTTKKK